MTEEQKTNVEKIETFQGEDEQWYYHAKAGNGEIVDLSEGYTRRSDAKEAAEKAFPGVPVDPDEKGQAE